MPLRENLIGLTKALRVYWWLFACKRNIVAFNDMRILLPDHLLEAWRLSLEFGKTRILRYIKEQAEEQVHSDVAPGSSNFRNLCALYVLCRLLKPKTVVETGVASGTSSLAILTALEKNGAGRLYSIDLPRTMWGPEKAAYAATDPTNLPPGITTGWLVPERLRGRWQMIIGEAKQELPAILEKLGRTQLFYHDSEHTRDHMLWEYRTVWPYLEAGGVLASDDVNKNEAFAEFASEKGSEAVASRRDPFGIMFKR